ncbi:uncharacterized protein LOC120633415 [Pararge aegeria]|uniref:uncharacterized protein LOC120633415 n=1 Tax=Pararge aegeria TaxID=116150 RepID=UPI0019D0BCC4|nr:uncharacterized protein LOC120633415 [Pararge aegeria]
MKYFVVFALCVAAASAFSVPPTVTGADAAQVQQIIEAIYHPSTDPATAAALEQMLFEILGMNKPVIVEDSELPTINEESIIDASPVIIDESIVSEPANYRPPLVQIIVNVNNAPENAVVVEQPSPIVIPGEVVVVEQPEADEVVVVEQPALPVEPVIIAPIVPAPVITLPDDLILKMKYFVVFALCVAAASAFAIPPTVTGVDAAQVQEIIEAIYHPSTDPATAAALEQLLLEILGMNKPVIVEDSELPTINEESIIDASPVIIDESIVSEPANYRPPLVQVIVNVNTNAPGNAVVVEQPSPVVIPGEVIVVEQPEADEVVVVEQPEAEEVVVVEQPEFPDAVIVAPVIVPEEPVQVPTPVIVAPIDTAPVTLPGTQN